MASLAISGTALAQQTPGLSMYGYGGLPTRAPKGGQTGLQLSEGALLHLGLGSEIGYDSNVYYTSTSGGAMPQGAGILRVMPFLEITNATRTGEVPSNLYYQLGASLLYREYLSNQVDAENRRAFMPSAGASVEFSGNQAVSLTLSDSFSRTEDPPYVSGAPIIRNGNQAVAQVRLTPGGGRLQGVVRYTNAIDIFASSNTQYSFADSMSHEGMLDFSWKWLPKTALFIQGRQGYVQYFHSDGRKAPSYPLRAAVGLRGLVTAKTTVGIALGYANGFYSNGQTTGGLLGSTYATADLTYTPMLTTVLTLGYRHDFQNSVISNFYYVDGVYAAIQQQVLGRIAISASGRWEHRNFQGVLAGTGVPPTRVDDFFQAGATVDFSIKGGLYAGVGYSLYVNQSDQDAQPGTADPNYLKHQVFGRLGFTY